MKRLDKSAMVTLLQTYETATTELKGLRDPYVAEFLRRMERHRAEAIAALTRQTGRVDTR